MTEKTKRAPGRPRKSRLEKPEQFSIRLSPMRRTELELIARSRNESLSQAVEYAVEEVAKVHEVGGVPAATAVLDRTWAVMKQCASFSPLGGDTSLDEISEVMSRNPRTYRAFFFPPDLRTPEESYFFAILDLAEVNQGVKDRVWSALTEGRLDDVLLRCTVLHTAAFPHKAFTIDQHDLSENLLNALFKPDSAES